LARLNGVNVQNSKATRSSRWPSQEDKSHLQTRSASKESTAICQRTFGECSCLRRKANTH
jgi:hypothetical protein